MKRLSMAIAAIIFSSLALFHNTDPAIASSDKFKRSERPISGRYIVVLADENIHYEQRNVPERVTELASEFKGRVDRVYELAVKGYSVEMTEDEAIRLSSDPRIKYVEEDGVVEPQSIQTNATWGISRIDQREYSYPLDQTFNFSNTGAGVHVYVIDTGVLTTHPDFQGRANEAFNASGDSTDVSLCNGHGTHVAGTIGSATYGVAKQALIHSVRVYPCWSSASVSNVISGIDWVGRHAVAPAVANMSFAATTTQALDDAVQGVINAGVTAVVAGANYADDACRYSPARLPAAITVGSMTQSDSRDPSTNYGRCIDLFAPGVLITSTWNEPNMSTNTISGTSMATPHVAGVAALYLQSSPFASPQEVQSALFDNGSRDVVYNIGQGSPNLLLYSGFVADGPPTPATCTGTEFQGSLVVMGDISFQSSRAGFNSPPGILSGRLNVPTNASFRLHLEKRAGGSRFNTVASSTGNGTAASVEYNARKGVYRWRIESLSGSGDYSLCAVIP